MVVIACCRGRVCNCDPFVLPQDFLANGLGASESRTRRLRTGVPTMVGAPDHWFLTQLQILFLLNEDSHCRNNARCLLQ